jgi:CP family cyanate transporter-like MFS transporter
VLTSDDHDVLIEEPSRTGRIRLIAVVAVLLTAFNLRLAVTSVGPVLDEIRGALGMSDTVAGLLTSVPVLCFAVFGLAAPRLAHRVGAARVILAGLALLTAGLIIRPYAPDTVLFLLFSVVALAGIAVVNVLLPVIVKEQFPDRVGAMTGFYSVALNAGASIAAAATVPLSNAFGGWRLGLAGWAVISLIALPTWFPLLRGRSEEVRLEAPAPDVRIGRSPVAWALAVFFGLQATGAYVIIGWLPQMFRDAGISAEEAGLLFGVASVLAVPMSFLLSAITGRMHSQSGLAAALAVAGIAGWAGMWWSPTAAPWLWAVLLGTSNAAFPLVLTMIALRGRTPAVVVKLSAFAQGVGYLIAIPGPILIGFLHDHSGGWRVPLTLSIALLVPQLLAGLAAGRNRQV